MRTKRTKRTTLYFFYELLTLITLPLVIFTFTKDSSGNQGSDKAVISNLVINDGIPSASITFDYQDEIFETVEKIAMNIFFEYYKYIDISDNSLEIFISKNNQKRLSICYNENLKVYNIVTELVHITSSVTFYDYSLNKEFFFLLR